MPSFGRLALEIDLDRRKKTLVVSETRLSASAYQDKTWESSEIGLIVLVVRLEAGPRLYSLATTTLVVRGQSQHSPALRRA